MTWSKIVAVSALALGLGGSARAEGAAQGQGKIEDPARTGQPGGRSAGTEKSPTTGATPIGTREISGRVVKSDASNVYLEHMGAIVPMRVDESTRFTGEGVTSSRDLAEGQEVRASFTVKGTTNVADKIAVATAKSSPPSEAGTAPGDSQGLPPGHPPVTTDRDPRLPPDRVPAPRDPKSPSGPVEPGTPPSPKY